MRIFRQEGAARRRGFTLLELMIVIAIMGLLGTVSVSGYRGLRKGIEERGTMQAVDEFVRLAYRRAIIDRAPTAVYFWNETVSDESSDHGGKLVVVGRAVAVRSGGRLSKASGGYLVDEFGDLADDAYTSEDSATGDSGDDAGRYLYKLPNATLARSVVASKTELQAQNENLMTRENQAVRIRAYAFKVKNLNGISWKAGDTYGFEFASLTLPKNFIFGSSHSTSVTSPEKDISVMNFSASGERSGGNVTVSGLQLDNNGAVSFQSIGTSEDPTANR